MLRRSTRLSPDVTFTAAAAGKGDHTPRHGGIVVEGRALDFEVVATPEVLEHGKAVKLDGAKGR